MDLPDRGGDQDDAGEPAHRVDALQALQLLSRAACDLAARTVCILFEQLQALCAVCEAGLGYANAVLPQRPRLYLLRQGPVS
ncbi:hypothetical protein [Xanthomonas prunicola]|uniref:hypothetical protein n=1 Tax=Xanthomonas prunicola TaxID=2053930 RepID=UPI0013906D40|nr:hypothetical protein [Xanthomonas prunicola]